jgi:hypothetical protein
VDLYIHYPIRLHGVVLNYLGTWTTLPFSLQNVFDDYQNVGERIRVIYNLKKLDRMVWTGFIWLRIGISGGLL